MKELPKKYKHQEAEANWQDTWFNGNVYHWDESASREETYVIDTPPPTVSGLLHMGHIFSYTQADFLARYQRMKGKTVFYPMGFDDNGLPTERLVEKVKKKRATDYPSREAFIEECEGVAEEARKEFRRLFESVALSVDWRQEYSTISDESRKISQLSFLDLFHKGKAYRQLQPMLWDPIDQTAIAQAEIEDKEMDSFENYLTFGLDDGTGKKVGEFQIMTTRPELLPACVAVMCDPSEAPKYEGKQAICPITDIRVPIIGDDKVDASKGTGMVMLCTFGDETDIEWFKAHQQAYDLPLRIILNRYGKIDEQQLEAAITDSPNKLNIVELLKGKKTAVARELFLEALKEAGAFVEQKPITHAVKCAERSGSPLEILPTQQWFVKVLEEREALKEKASECNWYPEYMKIRMDQWIDGLNWDWCISRQRYFGVPFPVWYVRQFNKGEWSIVIADKEQLPVNPLSSLPKGLVPISSAGNGEHPVDPNVKICVAEQDIIGANGEILFKGDNETWIEVLPEQDVMDTWATSSVSPQLNSKGITEEYAVDYDRHKRLFPADLRPQAHEIIRTWAFYTVTKAHLHENSIPWKNLMISGWCLASDKTKMSKSKGNVVTPVELIQERGADAVRFWASTSKLGTDTAFSEQVLDIGKKLVTKLWNASKFAALHLQNLKTAPTTAAQDVANGVITEAADKWMIARVYRAVEKADKEFARYEYSNARAAVEDLFWNDFCDNYLEIIKKRSYNEDGSNDQGQQSAICTVYHTLDAILRLFAPFVPHITEELYSHIFDDKYEANGSIHARGSWPELSNYVLDEEAEASGIATVEVLDAVRKIKAEKNVSIKWPIKELSVGAENDAIDALKLCEQDLKNVTNTIAIAWGEAASADATASEDGRFAVKAKLAEESDAA